MSYDNNIYTTPEWFGFTFIGEVDFSDGCYEFDLTGVWKKGRTLFWADDSGCSCPTPFEDTGVSDLISGGKVALRKHLNDRVDEYCGNPNVRAEISELLGRV